MAWRKAIVEPFLTWQNGFLPLIVLIVFCLAKLNWNLEAGRQWTPVLFPSGIHREFVRSTIQTLRSCKEKMLKMWRSVFIHGQLAIYLSIIGNLFIDNWPFIYLSLFHLMKIVCLPFLWFHCSVLFFWLSIHYSFIYHRVFHCILNRVLKLLCVDRYFRFRLPAPCYLVGSQELVYVYFGAGFLIPILALLYVQFSWLKRWITRKVSRHAFMCGRRFVDDNSSQSEDAISPDVQKLRKSGAERVKLIQEAKANQSRFTIIVTRAASSQSFFGQILVTFTKDDFSLDFLIKLFRSFEIFSFLIFCKF